MSWIYLDHTLVPQSEAKISVMDRGLLAGDGVYTTIQVKEGKPLFLEEHLKRLSRNCKELKIIPPTIDPHWIYALIEKNGAQAGIWRLKILITGGSSQAMRLPDRSYGHLILTVNPFSPPADIPLRLGCFPLPFSAPHASFKSLAHLNRYYVMEYAEEHGLDDAVTFTEGGILLEASFGNLVWVDKNSKKAWTPHPFLPLHFGVTISVVASLLERLGYAVEKGKKRLEEVPPTPTFRVNTMSGIRSIASIGNRSFPTDKALEEKLRALYLEEAEKMPVMI